MRNNNAEMNYMIEAESEPEHIGGVRRLVELAQSTDKKQRRAVGNIFKFLALLLALTLIARGTYGATLARVDTTSPSGSNIADTVTGSAIISSIDTLETFAPEGLTIAEMMTGDGQSVKNGEALARFDEDEVREKLDRASASLDKMMLDLERIERPESTDSSSIETAQRNLRRMQEDYEITRANEADTVSAAQEALDEALGEAADDPDATALGAALRSLQRSQEDYDYTKEQGEGDIAAAAEALATAKRIKTDDVEYSMVESAQRNVQRAQQDYENAISLGNAEVETARYILETMEAAQLYIGGSGDTDSIGDAGDIDDPGSNPGTGVASELDKARAALAAAEQKADEAAMAAWRRLEDAAAALNKAEQDYYRALGQTVEAKQAEIDRAQSALESAQKRAEENLLAAWRRVEDAEAALIKAENDFDRSVQQSLDSRLSEVDRARSALESAQKRAEENLLSARRRVEDAEASLRKTEQDYNNSTQQMNDNAAQNSISAISLRLDIAAEKAIIDALDELMINDCVLYSDLEGTVASAAPEGSVTGKIPLVTFRDGAKGYEALMKIKESDAEKLSVGAECEVTTGGGSMYYNPTVPGTVSMISTPDEDDRVTVTIRLPGNDWTQGQKVDVQAVLSRSNYDSCVPLSALHSDNIGYYLLTVEQQSSVLGVQNIVMRVNVNVVVSDSETVSVRGPVDRNSKIIIGSNKTITAGDRVRVNES